MPRPLRSHLPPRAITALLGAALALLLALVTPLLHLPSLHQPAPALAQTGLPAPVSLISPQNGATGQSLTLTLSWSTSSGATLYSVYLYDPSQPAVSGSGVGGTALNASSSTTSFSVPSGTLEPGHLYWWEIFPCSTPTSCNDNNLTVWSFTTAGSPPAFATLTSPGDYSPGATTTQTLGWSAPSDAIPGSTQYSVILYDHTAASGQGAYLANLAPTTTLSATIPSGEGLRQNVTYFWNLIACTNGNCSGLTPHWFSFTTAPDPGAPLPSAPSSGQSGVSQTPTLSWQPASTGNPAVRYYTALFDPAVPVSGHLLAALPPTSDATLSVPLGEGLFYGQSYNWTVEACVDDFCHVAASWPGFTVQAQPQATPSGGLSQLVPDIGSWGVSSGPGYAQLTVPVLSLVSSSTGAGYQATASFLLSATLTEGSDASGSYGSALLVSFNGAALFELATQGSLSTYGSQGALEYDLVASGAVSWPFSLPTGSGSFTIGLYAPVMPNGSGTLPSVQGLERLDLPPTYPGVHAGISAEPRFPKAVASAAPASVDVVTGGLQFTTTDLSLPGVAGPLSFTRTYQQPHRLGSSGDYAGLPLGDGGWGHNWQASLSYQYQTFGMTQTLVGATVVAPGGRQFGFSYTGPNGGPVANSFVAEPGVDATLTVSRDYATLTTVEGTQYVFFMAYNPSVAPKGGLVRMVDRNGNQQVLTYAGTQANNTLQRVTDVGSGRWLQFSYYAGVFLTGVSDSSGRSVQLQVTAGQGGWLLRSVTDVRGQVWTYGYEPNGQGSTTSRLQSLTDPLGHAVLTAAFDMQERVTTITDAGGQTLQYHYGVPAAGVTTVVDQNGHSGQYYWDANGRLTDTIDATQVRESWAYDVDQNTVGYVESGGGLSGGQQAASYDGLGNVLLHTDALDYSTTYTYDTRYDQPGGNLTLNVLLRVTDALGHTTTNTYDAAGNLLTTVDAVGHTVATNSYNAHGQVLSATNANNHTVMYGYSASTGDRTSLTDALGKVTTTAYTALFGGSVNAGWPTSVTDPLGHVTSTTYDAAGNVLTTSSVAGMQTLTTTTSYDADGRKHSLTDPNGHTTTWNYDVRGLLSTVTDANSGVTAYGYDPAGNRVTVTDANGKSTSYSFDLANRPLTETDPKTNVLMTLSYDGLGRVQTRTDARGVVVTYGYDGLSRVLSVGYSGGGTSTPSVAYTYDAVGNRLTMQDGTGTTSYLYDADNRPVSVTSPGTKVVGYSYDNAGNRVSIVYPSNEGTVTYGYDQDERLSSVTDWLSNTTSYSYDDASRLTQTTLPASTGVTSAFTYDESNRLLSVTHSKGGSTLFAASYTLDNAGNRTGKTTSGSAALSPGSESYTLDSLNRLTVASYASGITQTYSYDPVGNRTSLAVSGSSNPGTTSYTLDPQDPNRLVTVTPPTGPAVAYGYDAQGSTTSRGADTLSWDGENRLTSATIAGQSFAASYNGDGLRVSRTVSSATTSFVWDLASTPPVVLDDGTQYLYGAGLVARIAGGTAYFFLLDGLGSTVSIVDGSGSAVQRYGYDAYGSPTSSGGQSSDFQFAGQQTDPSGLQYLRARYYDPAAGRFLSRDPSPKCVFDPASHYPYTYGKDNPTRESDPSGLDPDNILAIDPNVPCDKLEKQADDTISGAGKVKGMDQREAELLADTRLYNEAYDKPNLGKDWGSYVGHQNAWSDLQNRLRNLVNAWLGDRDDGPCGSFGDIVNGHLSWLAHLNQAVPGKPPPSGFTGRGPNVQKPWTPFNPATMTHRSSGPLFNVHLPQTGVGCGDPDYQDDFCIDPDEPDS